MQHKLVADLHHPVVTRIEPDVEVAKGTQRIIGHETGQRDDGPIEFSHLRYGVTDVGRLSRAADGDQHIPRLREGEKDAGESIRLTVIVRHTCNQRRVVQGRRAQPRNIEAVCHDVACDRRAASVVDQIQAALAAAQVPQNVEYLQN